MSFDVHGHAQLQPAQPRPTQAGSAQALFTTVAFSWYVMIGSIVTFVVGAATSRLIGGSAMATE